MSRSAYVFALTALGLIAAGAAAAQPGPRADTVAWSLAAPAAGALKPGGKAVLTLTGAVKPGWHVYGLKQLENGPTPLIIDVAGEVARPAGAPTGTAPKVVHDRAFGLQTQYYERDFSLKVPVRLAADLPAGRQVIPVAVRFQTCDGQFCQPPKTVRLTAAVDVGQGR